MHGLSLLLPCRRPSIGPSAGPFRPVFSRVQGKQSLQHRRWRCLAACCSSARWHERSGAPPTCWGVKYFRRHSLRSSALRRAERHRRIAYHFSPDFSPNVQLAGKDTDEKRVYFCSELKLCFFFTIIIIILLFFFSPLRKCSKFRIL